MTRVMVCPMHRPTRHFILTIACCILGSAISTVFLCLLILASGNLPSPEFGQLLFSISGTLITTASLMIAMYFLVMAVDTYAKVRKLDKQINHFDEQLINLSHIRDRHQLAIESIVTAVSASLDASNKTTKQYLKKLGIKTGSTLLVPKKLGTCWLEAKRQLALLEFTQSLDFQRQMSALRTLSVVGKKSDTPAIKQFVLEHMDNKEVVELSHAILRNLDRRAAYP